MYTHLALPCFSGLGSTVSGWNELVDAAALALNQLGTNHATNWAAQMQKAAPVTRYVKLLRRRVTLRMELLCGPTWFTVVSPTSSGNIGVGEGSVTRILARSRAKRTMLWRRGCEIEYTFIYIQCGVTNLGKLVYNYNNCWIYGGYATPVKWVKLKQHTKQG